LGWKDIDVVIRSDLAEQGYLAQNGSYSGFIPTAGAGEYSCIAKTTKPHPFLGASPQVFNLDCFQQEKGWSFTYFGSPSSVNQVFAMLSPTSDKQSAIQN